MARSSPNPSWLIENSSWSLTFTRKLSGSRRRKYRKENCENKNHEENDERKNTFYPTWTSNSTLFMVELTRPWRVECFLPIEINIPKRFSSEGNSNILHWEKMLSFYVWIGERMRMGGEGRKAKENFRIFIFNSKKETATSDPHSLRKF